MMSSRFSGWYSVRSTTFSCDYILRTAAELRCWVCDSEGTRPPPARAHHESTQSGERRNLLERWSSYLPLIIHSYTIVPFISICAKSFVFLSWLLVFSRGRRRSVVFSNLISRISFGRRVMMLVRRTPNQETRKDKGDGLLCCS